MLRCYARIFFIMGGLFFLANLFANVTVMPLGYAVGNSLTLGLFLGGAISAVAGTIHIRKARLAAAGDLSGDIYAVRQSRAFGTRLAYERAYAALSHYLKETPGFTFVSGDQEAGELRARCRLKAADFGSQVSVSLRKAEGGGTAVEARARPALPTTLVDFGDNLRIVRGLEAHLRGLEGL